MKKYTCFDIPTQLEFWDADAEQYVGGIGFDEYIICGCCGALIPISEIYEYAPEDVEAILVYRDWIDISQEIRGA